MCLGVPGKVVAIHDAEKKLGVVDVAGVKRIANLACIVDEEHPTASCVGDWVLVHVGFAMSRIDETEAHRTLALLKEMDDIIALQDELAAGDAARRGAGQAGADSAPPKGYES